MKRVANALSLAEAVLLADLLKREGIAAEVFNQHAQGALGGMPVPDSRPQLWVREEAQAERAVAIVAAFRGREPSTRVLTCEECGEESPAEFETCWNCGKAHPA